MLKQHCENVGRDFAEIELSAQRKLDLENVEQSVQEIQAFVDAGVTHMVLYLAPPYKVGELTKAAEQILPRIEAKG
ncbi:MAG: hypothetical protein M9950_01250 [Thermomicrobiales bacterium]|nr:hypothetical protein [Thermomicrobiales bacterium]